MKNAGITFKLLLLFGIVTGVIYIEALGAPFYFDDMPNIKDNPYIRVTSLSVHELWNAAFNDISPASRFIPMITFAANYYSHGYAPYGYHVVNIIIHILSGLFLYSFIRVTMGLLYSSKVSDRTPINTNHHIHYTAFFATIIWLVHPLHTNSVTYIVQRMNSMAAMFFILSMLFYAKARVIHHSTNSTGVIVDKVYIAFCLLSWVLSLGCKQNALTLPFCILLFEFCFFRNIYKKWIKDNLRVLLYIAIFLILICYIYIDFFNLERIKTSLTALSNNEFTYLERVLTQPRVVIYYISLLFYPDASRLNLDYDYPLSFSFYDPYMTMVCILSIGIIIWFAFLIAKKEKLISFCILWFFGNLVVESSIIPLAIIFEHRTYLPSMTFGILVVVLIRRFIKNQYVTTTVLISILILFSGWTYQRNTIWGDKISFWQDCAEKSKNKPRPYINLGKTLLHQDKSISALKTLNTALEIDSANADIHLNLGVAFEKLKNLKSAIYHYNKSLIINPGLTEAHNNIGSIYKDLGNIEGAIKHYNHAISLNPYFPQAYYNLGIILEKQGEFENALISFKKSAQLEPKNEKIHNNLGSVLLKLGKVQAAKNHFIHAINIDPNYPNAHYNLGVILEKQNKTDKAIQHYHSAVKVAPEYFKARSALANALFSKGRVEEASRHFAQLYQMRDNLSENDTIIKVYFTTGLLYKNKKMFLKAVDQFKKALDINSKNIQALNQIAEIYASQGDNDTAISYYKRIIVINRELGPVYYNIACLYARNRNIEKATQWLEKATENGYNNIENIETDTDFKAIMHTKGFQKIIKRLMQDK